jgi:phage-related protein
MVNEDGKIEIGVGVNTEELDKYSKKLDKILKQMQQVNGTTVKSTSSVKNLDDKTKKLRETASKTVSGNGSRGLVPSQLLNKIPEYSKLSGSLGNIGSGVNRIKESVSFSRDGTRNIQNKTEHLSKSFEKLSTKTKVAQGRLGAIAEKGGVVGKAAGGLSKGFSKLGPLIARIGGLLARVGVALGPIGIALGVVAGVIGGVILAVTGMIAATAGATAKMKEFASTADNLVKERRSYNPTTATEAGAYRHGLISQTGKLADQLGRLSTTLANQDVIKFGGTLDVMKRRYGNVDDALDRHAKTTMRVTAFMDTLGMYLDSLKMGILDLIEPIISNTELLKGLATAIDVVTTPLMWIGKGFTIFAQVIGEVLSAIGNLIYGVVQFVAEIPILGDFVKGAMKAFDDKSSHAARDFVDDMGKAFNKYNTGYNKDPYKLNQGLYNTSFMNYQAMQDSPADSGVSTDDKEITDVTNHSLMNLFKSNFQGFTKPLLDFGFGLVNNISKIVNTIFTFITNIGEEICNYWDILIHTVDGIINGIKEFGEGIVNGIKGIGEGIVNGIKGIGEGIANGIKGIFKPLLEGNKIIGALFGNVTNFLQDISTSVLSIPKILSLDKKSKKNKNQQETYTHTSGAFTSSSGGKLTSSSGGKLTSSSGGKLTSLGSAPARNNNNNDAFALPEYQISTSAGNSYDSLELSNSYKSSSTGPGNEVKILDPRDVDIKININTEKADKDFVDQLTESLKKSFVDGLLHGY